MQNQCLHHFFTYLSVAVQKLNILRWTFDISKISLRLLCCELLLFACMHPSLAQEVIDVRLLTDSINDETGWHISSDIIGNLYILSDVNYSLEQSGALLRKINGQGQIVFSRFLNDEISNSARDLVLTKDGSLIALYKVDNSGTSKPDILYLLKIDLDGNDIWEQEINVNRNFFPSEHLEEIHDGTLALLSLKPYINGLTNDQQNYLTHLASDGGRISITALKNVRKGRIRNMSSVEKSNVLVNSMGLQGTVLTKIDLQDSSITWQRVLSPRLLDSTEYITNGSYDAILLDDQKHYGIVAQYSSVDSSLAGTYYFQTNLSGEIVHQKRFIAGSYGGSWPRIMKENENRLLLLYNYRDDKDDFARYLNVIGLTSEGRVVKEHLLEPVSFGIQIRSFVKLNEERIVGVGGAFDIEREGLIKTAVITFDLGDALTSSVKDEIAENSVKIWPNPNFGQQLQSYSSLTFDQVDLISMSGKRICNLSFEEQSENKFFKIDIPPLKLGMYFIRMHTRDRPMIVRKLVMLE